MPIYIDEVQTEVQVAGGAPAADDRPPLPLWQQAAQLRPVLALLQADEQRTAASGNDD